MRKSILFVSIIFLLVFFSSQVLMGSNLKLLRIHVPTDSKKVLLFNMDDLNQILSDADAGGVSGNLEFADLSGTILATLGKIKNGKVKWSGKAKGTSLQVKFKKEVYPAVREKINPKNFRPGFQVQITEYKKKLAKAEEQDFSKKAKYDQTSNIRNAWEITLAEFADLAVTVTHAIRPAPMPGAEMGEKVSVTIENKGTMEAKDFDIQVVLSSDLVIPVKPAVYSENFKEDVLLKDALQKVASVKAGEKVTITLEGAVKIPDDTPVGRYYLGAVVDPANTIEELDEKNNFNAKFLMITIPVPKRLVVGIPDMVLAYDPVNFGLQIQCKGVPLSIGNDWRKCRINPHLHQLKHTSWKGFHWEIDTADRTVWKVKGAKFCKRGGVGEEIKNIKVEVKGGSKTTPPSHVILRLSDTRFEYEPPTGKFKIITHGAQVAHLPSWNAAKLESHLYQFRFKVWQDSFWEVNAAKKQVVKVTGGSFGQIGGTAAPLDFNVKIE